MFTRRGNGDPLQAGLVALCISATLCSGGPGFSVPANRTGATRVAGGEIRSVPSAKPTPRDNTLLAQNAAAPLKTPFAASAPKARLTSATDTVITLQPATSPASGQSAVTVINVTGNNFPSDPITPDQVTLSFQPATAGAGPTATTAASAITTIVGSTRRVTFQIPAAVSISTSTPYLVSLSGKTTLGNTFSSGNPAALTVIPPAQILSITPNAASPGTSLTVTITTQYTNFLQGSTQANFGPGISVGGVPGWRSGPHDRHQRDGGNGPIERGGLSRDRCAYCHDADGRADRLTPKWVHGERNSESSARRKRRTESNNKLDFGSLCRG